MSNKPRRAQNNNNQTAVFKRETAVSYYGPIPPASEMARYEEIHPGFANRIMTMAENQSTHRQSLESIVVRNSVINSRLGVIFAFILAFSTIVIGALCIYWDLPGYGALIGGIGLVSIVGTFIYGTRSNREEREQKWRDAKSSRDSA